MKKFTILIISFSFWISHISAGTHNISEDSTFMTAAYIDSLVHTTMDEMHVPGAVVTIVKRGQVIFNKGYGYADIASKRMVDPEKSAFRLASITKPFTAIAIMKLVEEGKLNLHQDIRPLIADRHEFDWKYPLTIHQILTHTTGLDYSSIDSHKTKGENHRPNKKIKMLSQGHPPGDHFAYSNIAFGLLGYLIEKTTGLPYHKYMKDIILDPLEMKNSTFNTKLPPQIDTRKAKSYNWSKGENHEQPRQHLGIPAASSLESTGTDMAIFMNAVLNPEIFEKLGIISVETFHEMTRPQLPTVTSHSIGYSFSLGNSKNNPSIYHSGGVRGFLSLFNVFPTQDLGIFIAQNNRKGAEYFAWSINSKLCDILLPSVPADLSWVTHQNIRTIDIQAFRGIYCQPMHRNSTFEKAESLLANNEIHVEVVNDTTLSLFNREYKRIANTTFLETSKNSEWVQQFSTDKNGNIERFVNGIETYKKLKWYERIILKQIIVGFSFLVFMIGLILAIRNYFLNPKIKLPLFRKWILLVGNGYLLSFIALLIAYFVVETVKEGVPLGFKIPIIILTICGISSLAFPWAIYENVSSDLPMKIKIWNGVGIFAILAICIIFNDLNLIGMKW